MIPQSNKALRNSLIALADNIRNEELKRMKKVKLPPNGKVLYESRMLKILGYKSRHNIVVMVKDYWLVKIFAMCLGKTLFNFWIHRKVERMLGKKIKWQKMGIIKDARERTLNEEIER